MNADFVLKKPDVQDLDELWAYRDEFLRAGDEFHGDCALARFDDLQQWLDYNRALENHEIPETSWTAFDQYLYIRTGDNRIVGMINYRRTDDAELLRNAGEIGFSVRPSERNKGYAKAMLRRCLEICAQRGIRSAILTCNKENIASAKTIRACGGLCERVSPEETGMERYIIQI